MLFFVVLFLGTDNNTLRHHVDTIKNTEDDPLGC